MEIFKSKATWLLIIMILGGAFIGGLEQKNSVDKTSTETIQTTDLQK